MHPVLVEIRFPGWHVPWFALLVLVGLLGVALAVFAWTHKDRVLAVVGAPLGVGGLVAAVVWRHETLALGSIPVYSYGALLAVSFMVGWVSTHRLARADQFPSGPSRGAFFVAAIVGLIGARASYVLTDPAESGTWRELLAMHHGGLVAYGGFLAGLAGSATYLAIKRQPWLLWADAAAPSVAAGLMVTRVGCYLFGCDFGRPLSRDAPAWLQRVGTFPRWEPGNVAGSGSPAWLQHVAERGLSPQAPASLPVHPTQLYEAIAGGLLLVLALMVRRRRRFPGQVLLTFGLGYATFRFLVELLRDDAERGSVGPALARQVAVPCGLLALGAALAVGPARSIRGRVGRTFAWAAGPAAALGAYVLMRPAPFAAPVVEPLSTSQWAALLTGIAAALAWGPLERLPARAAELQAS
ncbi:MAG: prolipoprotein diacylglyceryl transferase [Polyangiaceae bacterium]|nr:prolipoprotein diacylglyceryl transferase [Polyangiaceae bacterium]